MLMEQAKAAKQAPSAPNEGKEAPAGSYKAPDWKALTPPAVLDAVERVVAAGAKLMYSPDMRDELMQAVSAEGPNDTKIADNVLGLLLMLDQKSQGGIPIEALFPAGVALMDEAAQVIQATGATVSQEDFDGAMMRLYAGMAQKMGAKDEDIVKSIGGALPEDSSPAPQEAAPTPGADPEMAAMQQGMQA